MQRSKNHTSADTCTAQTRRKRPKNRQTYGSTTLTTLKQFPWYQRRSNRLRRTRKRFRTMLHKQATISRIISWSCTRISKRLICLDSGTALQARQCTPSCVCCHAESFYLSLCSLSAGHEQADLISGEDADAGRSDGSVSILGTRLKPRIEVDSHHSCMGWEAFSSAHCQRIDMMSSQDHLRELCHTCEKRCSCANAQRPRVVFLFACHMYMMTSWRDSGQ